METKPALETLETFGRDSMKIASIDTKSVVETLNRILEMELAGAVLYTHYSFMVCGPDCMQFIKWLEGQAGEAMSHAKGAGNLIIQLGGHPSLGIAALTEAAQYDITSILRHSLTFEKSALSQYVALLELVQGKDVMVEEYARQHISLETQHVGEVERMLRRPGEIKSQVA